MPPASKKDVIYVDIEDDITSIIDKVKTAKASIVALVPPKRIGVLQSVVNLKLLQRAATGADKRVVMITNDSALSSLAAGVSMPVAKNLQSKPEVPVALATEDDEDEIIDGSELSVGDLANTAPLTSADTAPESGTKKPAVATSFAAAAAASQAPRKGSMKVPNFDAFRKKLFLIIGGGLLLIGFLVWAIFFAPHATVAITANTSLVNIDQVLQLRPNATTDDTQNILPAIIQQTKKTTAVDFDATGKKDVCENATGTVKFSTNSISNLGTTIPAGTVLTSSSGIPYSTDTSVTININNYQGAPADVTAVNRGSSSNGASGGLSGAPSGISASLTAETAGGTDKTINVVTQGDVEKAKQQLQAQDANAVKSELKKQFDNDMIVIDESFKADGATPVASPAVDQEATKAKLTVETTYTLVGLNRSELKSNFNAYLKKQLTGKENQKIYASGESSVKFSEFTAVEGGYTVKAISQAQVGPQINENTVKTQLQGKRAGEIQQQLESIEGIEEVQASFYPFWVTTAPSPDKITVKFVLKNEQ